jgi:hypothetical protein
MGLFSLNWFKSQKEKELENLRHEIEVKNLERSLERLSKTDVDIINPMRMFTSPVSTWTPAPSSNSVPVSKPYSNIKMVNDVLTVVLNDGSIITKSNANAEDFTKARECRTEACLLTLVGSPEIQKEKKEAEAAYEKAKNIQRGAEYLSKFKDFEMKHGSLYLKGINRSIPPLMVEKFLEIMGEYSYNGEANIEEIDYMVQEDEEYQGLKRFFMWCCLNPRAEVADKLYNFLVNNSFRITKQGFFVALRNVVTLHGSNELVHFVSNAYNKVKAVWKKKPDDYIVFLKHGEYVMVHKSIFEQLEPCTFCDESGNVPCEADEYDEDNDCYGEDSCECPECYGSGTVYVYDKANYGEEIGNLTELYLDLPNRADNRFTDAHTRTFDIRIGRAVSMDPGKCRWNTDDCGAEGLHFTSDEINYVGCGDTSVIVLINPMKVVGIGQSKGRCWEYLPIMTVPREEVTEILHDLEFDTLELDESYAIRELENLAEKAKEGFTAEATKYDFNLPALSTVEVLSIVKSLDEIKQEISKRIVNID